MNNSLESPSITNENYQNVINTNLSIDELKIPTDFNQKKRTLSNNQISDKNPINTFVKVREINFSYPSYNNTPFQNYFNHFLKETFGMNNTLNNPNYYFHNQNYQIQNNYESEYKNGSIDNSNIEKIMGNLNLENSSVFGGKKEQNNFQVNAYEDNDLIKSHIIIGNNQVRNDFFPEQEIKPFNPNYYIKNDLYNHKRKKSSGLHGYNFKEKIIDKEIFINYFRRTYRVNLKSFNYYDIKLINPKEIEEKIGKEKKRIEKIKKEMFERRKESRKNMDKKDTNLKLNEVLEDMCIYGITTKKELEEEKKINPNKFF